jgi:hypothetical protein
MTINRRVKYRFGTDIIIDENNRENNQPFLISLIEFIVARLNVAFTLRTLLIFVPSLLLNQHQY